MVQIYGIILLEKTEVVIRIYEVNKREWKLIHYQNFQSISKVDEISITLTQFFTTDYARYVTQWKTGSRGIPTRTMNTISASLGIEIDTISPMREQELLCKGLFTELW